MKFRIKACLLSCLFLLPISCEKPKEISTQESSEQVPVEYQEIENVSLSVYVANDGDDSNDGSLESPFKSLEKARDYLRKYKEKEGLFPEGNIVVYLRGGTYPTLRTFTLGAEDAGTAQSPVIYSAYRGERVTVSGGMDLPASSLEKVNDPAVTGRLKEPVRSKVRKIDLKKHGVSMEQFGEIQYWQLGGAEYPVEQGSVFVDGTELELSRYPKEGEGEKGDGFVVVGDVIDTGSIPRHNGNRNHKGATFKYTDLEPASWASHDDVWLYGYMKETYSDGTQLIASFDREANTITTVQPSWYGVAKGGIYYYQNVLEQLTLPGESVINPSKEIIYLIPPDGSDEQAAVELSLAEEPLLVIEGASHTTFTGIDFKLTRGDAVVVKDTGHVTMDHLSFTHIGGNGIVMPVEGVTNNTISNVTMDKIGGYPFLIGGGDRMAQTHGGSVVENCSFSDFGLKRSGISALRGIGNTVRNCEFTQSKAGGLAVAGNHQIIEYCVFKDLNLEGSDAGAVYCGRNPSETGIVIRYNHFQDIGNHIDDHTGIQGVYVDDRSGFVEVHGNTFLRVGSGVHAAAFKVNGGKYNSFHDNIIVDGRAAYIQIHKSEDGNWATWYQENLIANRLKEVGYPDPNTPWAKQNPLAFKAAGDTEQPASTTNRMEDNLVIDGELVAGIVAGAYADPMPYKSGNQITTEDPGFKNLEKGDFRIPKEDFEKKFPGIEWIDFGRIGLKNQRVDA